MEVFGGRPQNGCDGGEGEEEKKNDSLFGLTNF